MLSQAEQDAMEQNMKVARRWFTEGWTRNVDLADDIFSPELMTNGVTVGVAGPKTRIRERLTGFPDLVTSVEDMFAADNKVVTWLVWRGTHSGPYGGVPPTGKRVEVLDTAVWRFKDSKVEEIRTMQDQFAFLQQVGSLSPTLYAA